MRRNSRPGCSRSNGGAVGFTLIEAVVAILLVGIGIVAVFGGMRALAAADSKVKAAELLQRLALSKINELESATDPTTVGTGGDFTTQGYASNYTWTVDLETTPTTNLQSLKVTASDGKEQQTLNTVIYIAPTTTTTGATGTP